MAPDLAAEAAARRPLDEGWMADLRGTKTSYQGLMSLLEGQP